MAGCSLPDILRAQRSLRAMKSSFTTNDVKTNDVETMNAASLLRKERGSNAAFERAETITVLFRQG
jgi:hypothetical protein